MAKNKSSKRAPAKPAAPGSVRRITHTVLVGDADTSAGISYKVYGLAKKVFIQNTTFGRVPGLKGLFEAVAPDGKVMNSKRCFLPPELHAEVAAKLGNGDAAEFGMVAEVKGEEVAASFFADPAPTDPMARLREQAQE